MMMVVVVVVVVMMLVAGPFVHSFLMTFNWWKPGLFLFGS